MKPNRPQFEAAKAVIAQYGVNYKGTGADTHQNTAVMAIFAILTGQITRVPSEYWKCVEGLELSPQVGDTVELPDDASSSPSILVPVNEYDRIKAILEGITVDHEQRNFSISEDAAVLLRAEGSDFPEPGIYIPHESAGRMTEKAIADATDPDNILDKEAQSHNTSAEPNDDDKAEADLDSMTIDALRSFAAERGIDLRDIRRKAAIIAAIREFGF